MPLKLTYWPIRGLKEFIVTLCKYLQLPVEQVLVSPEEWGAQKSKFVEAEHYLANLPLLEDTDVPNFEPLPESWAIMVYIVQKSGKNELLPKQVPDAEVVRGTLFDLKIAVALPAYMSPTLEAAKMGLNGQREKLLLKLKGLNKRLGNNNWLMGEQLTIFDFFGAELLELVLIMNEEQELNLTVGLDNLKPYVERFNNLPGVKEFRASPEFKARPFNNAMAVWK